MLRVGGLKRFFSRCENNWYKYFCTATAIALIGLVLSWFMRMQIGFGLSIVSESFYYQAITMHGMIMVVYFLTALFLGGFGNYLIPLMVGARDMVFPLFEYDKLLDLFIGLFSSSCSFFTPGGPTGAGWTLYPPQAILGGTPGQESGIILMLISLSIFIVGFTMGGLKLYCNHTSS